MRREEELKAQIRKEKEEKERIQKQMANDATIITEQINTVPIIEVQNSEKELFMNSWGIIISLIVIIALVGCFLGIIITMYYRYVRLQEQLVRERQEDMAMIQV